MIKEDIVNILIDVLENGKYSNIQLNYYFNLRKYEIKEKAFITNIVNLVIKNHYYLKYLIENTKKIVKKRKIRYLLEVSLAQILYMRTDKKSVISEAVNIAKKENIYQSKFVKYMLENILKDIDKLTLTEDVKYSYPIWFIDSLKKQHKDYLDILKEYKNRSYLSVRIDKRNITKEKFIQELKKLDIEYIFNVEDVFYFNSGKILNTYLYTLNLISIQDASSYIVVRNLDINSTDYVLDACAAPGGKTLAMLQMYDIKHLVAIDIHKHRTEMLEKIKTSYNYSNLEVITSDILDFKYNKKFNKILLDMPCSGLGVLRKKPEKIYRIEKKDVINLQKIQRNIFSKAYELLEKGGQIVYSTCTILPEENTENTKYFLEKYKDLRVKKTYIPDNVKYKEDEFNGVYITHENNYLDGFYIIKYIKE